MLDRPLKGRKEALVLTLTMVSALALVGSLMLRPGETVDAELALAVACSRFFRRVKLYG